MFKHSVRFLPWLLWLAATLWPQKHSALLACRQETNKHQKKTKRLTQSLKRRPKQSRTPYHERPSAGVVLNLISQKSIMLNLPSEVKRTVGAAPFQTKLPLSDPPRPSSLPRCSSLYLSFLPVNMPGKSRCASGPSSWRHMGIDTWFITWRNLGTTYMPVEAFAYMYTFKIRLLCMWFHSFINKHTFELKQDNLCVREYPYLP